MERDVFMRIEPVLATIMCELPDSDYKQYLRKDGSLIVKLERPLYGTLEAAKLWYNVLSSLLLELGFIQYKKDSCVFNMVVDGVQLTIGVYVDDLLCTCVSESALEWLGAEMEKSFPGMTINKGQVHSYLGETWDFSSPGKVKCTMEGNIGQVLADNNVTGEAKTPAAADLFGIDVSSPLLDENARQLFHSNVQKLQWISKGVMPELGPFLSFAMPRVNIATEQDLKKLDRAMRYLNANKARGIVIEPHKHFFLHSYVDASFAPHADMKSHTGATISLGKGPVFTQSVKQKGNATSSTEAELIGVAHSLSQIIWVRDFLIEQGYDIGPAVLYQDNRSTIKLAERGNSASQRTRHVAIKFFFVHDRMEAGEIVIEYMPTGFMLADILTKPLHGSLFRRLRAKLNNWYEPGEEEEFSDDI
jgi:hypothetical protein